MSEPMTVVVEVWPLAADEAGIWLLSGSDAIRPSLPVGSDSEPHAEVELALSMNDFGSDVALLHSTSWRVDGPRVILTYVALVQLAGKTLVRDRWSKALPVSPVLLAHVGNPPTNAATDAPAPRYIDVLLHAVRHLRFLLETDGTARMVMDENWRGHLNNFSPALSKMYEQGHNAA